MVQAGLHWRSKIASDCFGLGASVGPHRQSPAPVSSKRFTIGAASWRGLPSVWRLSCDELRALWKSPFDDKTAHPSQCKLAGDFAFAAAPPKRASGVPKAMLIAGPVAFHQMLVREWICCSALIRQADGARVIRPLQAAARCGRNRQPGRSQRANCDHRRRHIQLRSRAPGSKVSALGPPLRLQHRKADAGLEDSAATLGSCVNTKSWLGRQTIWYFGRDRKTLGNGIAPLFQRRASDRDYWLIGGVCGRMTVVLTEGATAASPVAAVVPLDVNFRSDAALMARPGW
jgi:hypothetical protein